MRQRIIIVGLASWLFSFVAAANDFSQQVTLNGSLIGNGTCDLSIAGNDSASLYFDHVAVTNFATGLPAGSNSGKVMHFSLSLTNCQTVAGGTLTPRIKAAAGDYVVGDCDVDNACLWRSTNSDADGVGFIIRKGNINDIAPASWWPAGGPVGDNFVTLNSDAYTGYQGAAQGNVNIPFSVVMSCGACNTTVSKGFVYATITFTFMYA